MKKALLGILLFLNFLAIIALLISYLSVYVSPDKQWIPSLFGLAYPFVLIINVLFMLFWLLFKPRYILISLIAIVIGWGFFTRYVQFKGKSTEKGEIKVLSYNVKHFNGNNAKNHKENANKIVEFLDEQKADIICLQEVRLRKNSIFNLPNTVKNLDFIKHYQYARTSTTYGSVTMTRFPIVNMGEIRFENSRNMSIYTDVIIKKDTIRIFNVHLQSYHINPDDYAIIGSPGITEEEDIREMRALGSKYKKAIQLRAEQVREIRNYMDDSPYDILVCGDFNDTPASYSYRMLSTDLKDAFICSGKGIGRTYIGKLPSFRIDYILHSAGFESFNFSTLDFAMSDHLPIICDLVKK